MKPMLIAVTFALSAMFLSPVRAQDEKLTADQILEKHLAAIGGREALGRLKTRVAAGTVRKDDEPNARFAIMSEAPNRLAAVYVFRDYDLRMVYNGKTARIAPSFARQYGPLTTKYEEMISSGLMFNQISLYNALTSSAPAEFQFEAKGTKKIAGRPAYIVQAKPKKGATLRLYFDAETFMWVRTDFGKLQFSRELREFSNDVVNQAGSEVSIDFYIETSDFREVDGVKLPFKFEQVMTSPILRQKSVGTVVGTIQEYKHNIQIDPAMFQ